MRFLRFIASRLPKQAWRKTGDRSSQSDIPFGYQQTQPSNNLVLLPSRPPTKNDGATRTLLARKEGLLILMQELDKPSPTLMTRIENASDHQEQLLVTTDVFYQLAIKFGEVKAHEMVTKAMKTSESSPTTKPLSLSERQTS